MGVEFKMDIKQAISSVKQDDFVKENGKLLPQTTHISAIEKGLRMLNVREGNRVLEIGTGSGLSTALLAQLVGDQGSVVSVDIDPTLTKRAKSKLAAFQQVQCMTGDGRNGYSPSAPYDRIVAWTTPKQLPKSWSDQIGKNGILVAPFQVLPLAWCIVTVRLQEFDEGWIGDLVSDKGYIPMTDQPVTRFFGYEAQANWVGEGEDPYWVSSLWMERKQNQEWIKTFLTTSLSSGPGTGQEIRPFLLGTFPEGLTTAYHPEYGFFIGYSTANGFALVSDYTAQWLVSDQEHAKVLCHWWEEWKRWGKPSYEQLQPFLEGKSVKVKLQRRDLNA